MTHFPHPNPTERAPRIHLNGSVAAAIHSEGGQKARAKLQSISITGGLLQMPQELSAGDFVEIAFHTRSGPVQGMAGDVAAGAQIQERLLPTFPVYCFG